MDTTQRNKRGTLAVIGSSIAIFWPGALVFSFPGVMGPYWQNMFRVGQGAIGNILFFVLAAAGTFMFIVGRWQKRFGIKRMITIGSVLLGLNGLNVAFASGFSMIYLWAFLMGVSANATPVSNRRHPLEI